MSSAEIFINDSKNLSKEAFTQKYSYPFLVSFSEDTSVKDSLRFATIATTVKIEDILKMANQPAARKINTVFPVTKSDRNKFASKIIVGRTSNVDIIIDSSKISKFHAYFEHKENDAYTISDPGSTNGTFLNNRKLNTSEPQFLRSKDIISFSDIGFTFYTSDEVYEVFQKSS